MSQELPRAPVLEEPLVRFLAAAAGPQTIAEIDAAVARELSLTQEQLAHPHDPKRPRGRTEFAYRMAWARSRLKAKGTIENTGFGRWTLSKR